MVYHKPSEPYGVLRWRFLSFKLLYMRYITPCVDRVKGTGGGTYLTSYCPLWLGTNAPLSKC